MTIGKIIVKMRKERKISQEKLAELLGITRQTLSNYENDITSPDLNQTKKICQIFDISLDEMIGNNNTLSSKISSTERLVKKQNKNTRIILITLYIIIMTFLISYIIYAFTKRDFTKEYQVEFTCVSKEKEHVTLTIEGGYGDGSNPSNVTRDFVIIAKTCDGANCVDDDYIYAGKSFSEAMDSLMKAKKVLINQDYKCY